MSRSDMGLPENCLKKSKDQYVWQAGLLHEIIFLQNSHSSNQHLKDADEFNDLRKYHIQ
jgi:hypothetical protein